MKTLKLLFIGLICLIAFSSFAEQGKWVKGFGQGNLEYSINNASLQLRINCPTQKGSDTASSGLVLVANPSSGEDQAIKSFKVEVNGNTYIGPFYTGSRVDDNNFISFLDDIRKTDAKVTFGKNVITFPVSNVASVVPTYKSKNFSCNIL